MPGRPQGPRRAFVWADDFASSFDLSLLSLSAASEFSNFTREAGRGQAWGDGDTASTIREPGPSPPRRRGRGQSRDKGLVPRSQPGAQQHLWDLSSRRAAGKRHCGLGGPDRGRETDEAPPHPPRTERLRARDATSPWAGVSAAPGRGPLQCGLRGEGRCTLTSAGEPPTGGLH